MSNANGLPKAAEILMTNVNISYYGLLSLIVVLPGACKVGNRKRKDGHLFLVAFCPKRMMYIPAATIAAEPKLAPEGQALNLPAL